MSVISTHYFGRFWSVSCTITHCFWVPKRFPRLTIPGVRLRVRRQHSWFWSILTHFVDYYSPFSGSKAISMVVESQGVLTCCSSRLSVWADSGPCLGLLLTFGVPKRFPRLTNPRVRLRAGHKNTHNFGQFWSVSWTITHHFGVPEQFP